MAESEVVSETKGQCDLIDTVHIKPHKMHGFLAFARFNEQSLWMLVYPVYPIGVTPPSHRPSPLFETREAVIRYVQDENWVGSEVKIFEVRE